MYRIYFFFFIYFRFICRFAVACAFLQHDDVSLPPYMYAVSIPIHPYRSRAI